MKLRNPSFQNDMTGASCQSCHFLTDKKGLARYDLGVTHIVNQYGKVEGMPDEQQQQGLQRMYQILKKAGKTSNNIDYDFQYE